MKYRCVLTMTFLMGFSACLEADQTSETTGITTGEIDLVVERAMVTFNVPGVAVGVVKDGKVIHAKGYGIQALGKDKPIDAQTLFGIASNGKAFTTTALAILVDEGKIGWDDKVIDHIPEFRLIDPWVTAEFTIRDLLTHRSGLGKGAGDLMFWPYTDFSREEIIKNLRHLKMASGFRTKYAYDNLLYLVAGEIIPVVTGQSYEDFVDQRILTPLSMRTCATNLAVLKKIRNIAEPHILVDGVLQQVERPEPVYHRDTLAAAGGLQCSVDSMLKWLTMHLDHGKLSNGAHLISAEQHKTLWTPQVIKPVSEEEYNRNGTHFAAYGLGFNLRDMHGYQWVQHGGSILGMVSHVSMIPELDLGVVVLTNGYSDPSMLAIANTIIKSYMPVEKTDWVSLLERDEKARVAEAKEEAGDARALKALEGDGGQAAFPLVSYMGRYRDPWLGDMIISEKGANLYVSLLRSPLLKGVMKPFKDHTFVVRWDDRTLEADAFVRFSTDFSGQVSGITMKAVSSLTDFSFDFHDLNFKKVQSAVKHDEN